MQTLYGELGNGLDCGLLSAQKNRSTTNKDKTANKL